MGNAPVKSTEGNAPVANKQRRVRLVVTPLGPLLPVYQAYHTSISVGDREFSFSGQGISVQHGHQSHINFSRGQNPLFLDVGFTEASTQAMMAALQPHFLPGTYDLLRKNCNSFSDCAIAYLLGQRLMDKYRAPEKLGAQWDKYVGVVQNFTGGFYQPNPRADGFKSCKVVEEVGLQAKEAKGRALADKMERAGKMDVHAGKMELHVNLGKKGGNAAAVKKDVKPVRKDDVAGGKAADRRDAAVGKRPSPVPSPKGSPVPSPKGSPVPSPKGSPLPSPRKASPLSSPMRN